MFDHICFVQCIEDLHAKLQKGSYLLLIAEETPFLEIPKYEGVHVCGAIFPRVVFKGKTYATGIIVARLSPTSSLQIIDMDTPSPLQPKADTNSVLVIVDGFSSQIDDFLEEFYSLLPEKTKLIGGGAGKTCLVQEPIMFDAHRFYMNAAIILTSTQTIGVGVKHGWKPILGPFIATTCNANILEKINFKNAFEVYKEAVEKDSDMHFESTPFFKISQRYPLGIVRYNKDFIVREPVSTDGNNIVLVGKLDCNSVLSILKAGKDDLLEAAKEAAEISYANKKDGKIQSVFMVDCVSRYSLLDTSFQEEINAISNVYAPKTVIWGVISLGEIANANQENIEFYNNTCVVGTL